MHRFIRLGLIVFAGSAAAAPIFTVRDLGSLGGTAMRASSINAAGQAVGSGQNASQAQRAFEYSDGVLRDITPDFAGNATAAAINDRGQIAGAVYSGYQAAAALWDAAGHANLLPGLGGMDSFATAINAEGVVVGMATTASGEGHPFLYFAGVTADLGLPAGAVWGSAYGVNASGVVAGYSMNAYGAASGFVWSASSGYSAIGALGGRNSYAMAINDNGQVAGHAATGSGYLHAMIYLAGIATDIGTLGGSSSYAYGINNFGAVVGYSLLADNGVNHAFLYQNGLLFDLNLLLASPAGWELTAAYGINDAGQIVGTGILNGVQHAFELDPVNPSSGLRAAGPALAPTPEPGAAALGGTGLMALLAALYWRRRTSP
jgi:probable HAF family extracellular repeat protein